MMVSLTVKRTRAPSGETRTLPTPLTFIESSGVHAVALAALATSARCPQSRAAIARTSMRETGMRVARIDTVRRVIIPPDVDATRKTEAGSEKSYSWWCEDRSENEEDAKGSRLERPPSR